LRFFLDPNPLLDRSSGHLYVKQVSFDAACELRAKAIAKVGSLLPAIKSWQEVIDGYQVPIAGHHRLIQEVVFKHLSERELYLVRSLIAWRRNWR
jgi:hypothetical protein